MLPLATISFAVGALLFAGYAASLHWYTRNAGVPRSYPCTYYALALAFFCWSAASAVGNSTVLAYSVLIGNALILFGTVCLINGLVAAQHKRVLTILASVLGLTLLILRIISFPPHPYLENGILIFNTDSSVSALYTLLFLFVWLPANMSVGKIMGAYSGDHQFWIKWLFAVSTLAALLLPAVHSFYLVVGTFIVVILCYSVLIAMSILLRKGSVKKQNTGQENHAPQGPYDALPGWLKKVITFFAISVVLNMVFPGVIPQLLQTVLTAIISGVGGVLAVFLIPLFIILLLLGGGGGMHM